MYERSERISERVKRSENETGLILHKQKSGECVECVCFSAESDFNWGVASSVIQASGRLVCVIDLRLGVLLADRACRRLVHIKLVINIVRSAEASLSRLLRRRAPG